MLKSNNVNLMDSVPTDSHVEALTMKVQQLQHALSNYADNYETMKNNYDGLYWTVSSRIPNESEQLAMIPSPEIFDLGKQWLSNLSQTCFDENYALSQASHDPAELDRYDAQNPYLPTHFPRNDFQEMNEQMKLRSSPPHSPTSYLQPAHEVMQGGVGIPNYNSQKKRVTNINGSQYGSKPADQTTYRNYPPVSNPTSAHQPAKTKNKSEWNFYINQAAAVGRNKPATIPTTVGAVPDHDQHWNNNQNRRRTNGIEFNGLVHTKFHSNQSMRY
mmetsp:Transcript_18835/g.25759  ORF Transcript_18835/g.25759 Transcript_18835/m.25759 type:complete len:273 (+) Transcript_18835:87-905(+)